MGATRGGVGDGVGGAAAGGATATTGAPPPNSAPPSTRPTISVVSCTATRPTKGIEYFLYSGDVRAATGAPADGGGICTAGPDPVVVRPPNGVAPVVAVSRLPNGELDGAGT